LQVSPAVGLWLIDRPTTRRLKASGTDGTVDRALSRGVLGDVAQPELVGAAAAELAVDKILGGRDLWHTAPLAGAVATGDPARCISIATALRPTSIPLPSVRSA
jgi:hypothetical protein